MVRVKSRLIGSPATPGCPHRARLFAPSEVVSLDPPTLEAEPAPAPAVSGPAAAADSLQSPDQQAVCEKLAPLHSLPIVPLQRDFGTPPAARAQ